MTDNVKRTLGGQFARGQSGNPAGARSHRKRGHMTLREMHEQINAVGRRETTINVEGRTERMTMVARAAMALASGRQDVNRAAARDIVELALSSARYLDDLERREREEEEKRSRRERGI